MSVVLNTNKLSSVLKKKRSAINYHQVGEAIAAKILWFAHISSEKNLAEILTKPWGNQRFYELVKPHLFRVSLHAKEEK